MTSLRTILLTTVLGASLMLSAASNAASEQFTGSSGFLYFYLESSVDGAWSGNSRPRPISYGITGIAPFDPVLGTLTGATISMGFRFGDLAILSPNPFPTLQSYSYSGFNGQVNLKLDNQAGFSNGSTRLLATQTFSGAASNSNGLVSPAADSSYLQADITLSGPSTLNFAPTDWLAVQQELFANGDLLLEVGAQLSFQNLVESVPGLVNGIVFLPSSGVIDITTTYDYIPAAIPEPESYAMMLAGLGLLGFMARRKKSA